MLENNLDDLNEKDDFPFLIFGGGWGRWVFGSLTIRGKFDKI
jgi:hypothetical protein